MQLNDISMPREREKSQDSQLKLHIPIHQLYSGELLHLTYQRPVVCFYADECVKPRKDCQGPGLRVSSQRIAPNYVVQTQKADPSCVDNGKGWVSGRCNKCPYGPTELKNIALTAVIEPGMKTGDIIKFEGAGQQSISQDPGDLVLVIVEDSENDK